MELLLNACLLNDFEFLVVRSILCYEAFAFSFIQFAWLYFLQWDSIGYIDGSYVDDNDDYWSPYL